MAKQLWFARRIRCRAALLSLLTLAFAIACRPDARAAELAEHAHSLGVAPADAAFYSASLRLKEQLDIFLESKAYARLMEIPIIQIAKMQVMFQWQQSTEPAVAEVRNYVQSPEGQEAVAVLKEMFSDEIFLYAGSNISEWIKLLTQASSMDRAARMQAKAEGEDPAKGAPGRFFKSLSERISSGMTVPTMVVGFRIKDAERAKRELNEVHSLVRNLLDEHKPELSAHLQRDQIAGHEFLTLRVDGSMIPWDRIRQEAEDEAQVDEWRELLSDKTLAIALGVVDEFVLLSVGDSTDHLETFGQGQSLADQPAIQRLAKHADQRLVSIAYVSESLAKSMGSAEQTVEELAGAADEILQQAEVDDEQRQELIEDIRALDLSKYMPKPGHVATVAFLTPRGYEGFQYNAGTRPMMDSSKPLSILNHVGGNPMLLVATRSNDTVEDYDEAIAWLRQTAQHVEQIVETKADPEDWARYMQYRDRGIELLRRINNANREHLYPAFADNQGAVVLDVAAQSKQWVDQMPESPKPLPMLELGVVASVSDPDHLRQGAREYLAVLRDAIALMREINPDEVPDFELPRPNKRELAGGGTLYAFPLPEEWGVDSQISANAGMTDAVAVASTLPGTTERLLAATPIAADTTLDFNRPAAMVVHFEFRKMIDAVRPWINYGLDVAMGKLKTNDDEDEPEENGPAEQSPMMIQLGFIVPQIEQFLNVATALRSASSVTYEEEGLWVTHSETHFEDLK